MSESKQKLFSGGEKSFKRIVPVVLIAGSGLVFFLPVFREQLGRVHEISGSIADMGWAAPIVFTAAVAALVAVGIPRLLFCPIGGMVFGFWQGLLWMQIGTLLGYYATFLFVRWSGRELVLRTWPRLSRYTRFTRKNGILSVLLIRQLPITGFYINLLLGLMSLTHADFLLGSAIGILPAAIPATLMGSGAIAFSSGASQVYTLLALAAGIGLWLVAARLLRGFLKATKGQAESASAQDSSNRASTDLK